MRLITASHITDWAQRNKRDCQSNLPLLVRMLIRATAEHIDELDMPVGDSISDEGWDGRLLCRSSNRFVPSGCSGWENGTDPSAQAKATSDYKKRTANSLGIERGQATFVFVTPRSWPSRGKWLEEARLNSHWKAIRVITARDLEAWLEDAPGVALWLSWHLGLSSQGSMVGLAQWWEKWSTSTRPVINYKMVTAGRDKELRAVQDWLKSSDAKMEVQGDTPDEAIAFLAAALVQGFEGPLESAMSRCVVALTQQAFDDLATWSTPLIIAASADHAVGAAGLAGKNGHRLYLAVPGSMLARRREVRRLERLDRHILTDALTEAKLTRAEAAQAISECGRSLAVFCRRRSLISATRYPGWAGPELGPRLVPALLAGGWSEVLRPTEDHPLAKASPQLQDRLVVCGFQPSIEYYSLRADLQQASSYDNSPFYYANSTWGLRAPLDAWFLLGAHVQPDHLVKLGEASIVVFSTLDPKYELPEDKQWMASAYGKEAPHSRWLREGLAGSLAVVAQHGADIGLITATASPTDFVDRICQRIFEKVSSWQHWASLGDVLPLLGEAAPGAFLTAVESLVADHTAAARELLTDGGGGAVGGECRHAGLLWTLERLAWHPNYLERVCLVLARLHSIDPGGRWGNRPLVSLFDILMSPIDPYTFADLKSCTDTVDKLVTTEPETAWRLLMSAVSPFQSRIVRNPPTFLAARPEGWRERTQEQSEEYANFLVSWLAQMIERGQREVIVEALSGIWHLPELAQEATASWLAARSFSPVNDAEDPLWQSLLHFLRRHNSSVEGWQLSTRILEDARRAEAQLAPTDESVIGKWLFGSKLPSLIDADDSDWRAMMDRVRARRSANLRLSIDRIGLEGTLEYGEGLPDQHAFGLALAEAATTSENEQLLPLLLKLPCDECRGPPALLIAYFYRRQEIDPLQWFSAAVLTARELGYSEGLTGLFLTQPISRSNWEQVAALGDIEERLYWRWLNRMPSDELLDSDWDDAIRHLLGAGRADYALHWLSIKEHGGVSGDLLRQVAMEVIKLINEADSPVDHGTVWRVERLFDLIDQTSDLTHNDIGALEWAYMPLLLHSNRKPKCLFTLLSRDPSLFVGMIRLVWPGDVNEVRETDIVGEGNETTGESVEAEIKMSEEQRKHRADIAYDLLRVWRQPIPGQAGSDVDVEILRQWVEQARALLAASGHRQIGDAKIGELLSGAIVDTHDGIWPHAAVRTVLNDCYNRDLASGFVSGKINARGVTTRNPMDGGGQERALSEHFATCAKAVRFEAPRAAQTLDDLAKHYSIDADREDAQAELRRLV